MAARISIRSLIVAGLHGAGATALSFCSVAVADIYKWTDAQGATVISNVAPQDGRAAQHIEVIAREPKGAKSSAPAETQIAATERRLLERIENLERELRAERSTRAVPYDTPSYTSFATRPPVYPDAYPPSHPSYYSYPSYAYPHAYSYVYPSAAYVVRPRAHRPQRHWPVSQPFRHGRR